MSATDSARYDERILGAVAEGVAVVDADGRFTFANPAAARILGTPVNEIVGRRYDDPVWKFTFPDGTAIPVDEAPLSLAMRTGEPVSDAVYGVELPDGRHLVLTINAVPFAEEGHLSGALISFSDVTAVQHVQTLDRALTEISRAVHSSLEFDTIIERGLPRAVEALGCESAVIFLNEGSDWVMRYLCNLPEDMQGVRVPEEQASFTTLTGGKAGALAFNDAYKDERIDNRLMRRFHIHTLLDVMIRVRGRDIADVSFINMSEAGPFTEDDVFFADRFGAIVGLALDNGELYRTERDTSELLQKALLGNPAPIDGIVFSHTYRSGTTSALVGGDFYDLLEIDQDHVALLLGDVSGKGLPQATTAGLAKHTMTAYLLESEAPGQVVERTSRVLERSTDGSIFVTAVVAVLDKRSGRLTYCNAGHPDPLVSRVNGEVERLTERSHVLGVFSETEFPQAETSLAEGDVLLLYTDGVTEARGPEGVFGDERIAALLGESRDVGVPDLANHVMARVSDYAQVALSDDVAILAVQRIERGA